MSKVITFSRQFPSYHPRKGEPTYFVEKFWWGLPINIDYKILCDLNEHLKVDVVWDFWRSISKDVTIVPEFKFHTIRAGHRFKVGDKFSPRVWGNDINPKSGRKGAYHSKQIIIAPDIEVKKVWNFEIKPGDVFPYNHNLYGFINGNLVEKQLAPTLAANDGLSVWDMDGWFNKPFEGQIICWNQSIEY